MMEPISLAEKLDKIRSPNLQSQRQTAIVLEAVEKTLQSEDSTGNPTPTAYFAALLALLTQSSSGHGGEAKTEVAATVVYLLDIVIPFVSRPLLRAKFTQILALLDPVLSQSHAAAPLLRPAIGCLEVLLLAQDLPSWELSVAQVGPRRAVIGLLTLALDPRPKVRRRAVEALEAVLQNPPPNPSIDHPAAAMCAEAAMEGLARAATAWKEKKLEGAKHDPDLIHTLHLARAVASAKGGWPIRQMESLCDQLLLIARDGGEHTTMAVFDVFEMIFEGMVTDTASAKLPRLLSVVADLTPGSNDAQLLGPWLAILSRSYSVAAQVDGEDTFAKLPDLFAEVIQFLESDFEGVRISASECLVSFVANCIPRRVILEPTVYDEKILERLASGINGLLSTKFQAAWRQTFRVLVAIYDSLRWRAYPYFLTAAQTVGGMRGEGLFAGKKDADLVLGSAIRAMGPKAILHVLPLNLGIQRPGQPGRAWLLSLLRDYTANTHLAHFRSELVPLSELMFQRVLDHGFAERTTEVKIYETIVQQIWSAFPGYCDLPLDLQASFDQSFAELLANLLYQQVDLRHDICRGLRTVVESNQAIAAAEGEEDLILQSRVAKSEAESNLKHLGQFAGNFLAVLFNVYSQTLPQSRAPILDTINAFLSISPTTDVVETFGRVHALLTSALQEQVAGESQAGEKQEEAGDSTSLGTAQTLLDLVVTMSIYLPRDSFASLSELVSAAIHKNDRPQVQKKAYKLIPRLARSPEGKTALEERIGEVEALMLASADTVSAPARRDRMAALAVMIPLLPVTDLHFIPSIVSEVVICCKEHNERTRTAAFDLLVIMGQKMLSSAGAAIDNRKVRHMPQDSAPAIASIEEYFTMISAGLAGSTPHMIAASITALSRILFEFRQSASGQILSDLVDTMDLFLASNNREIVKAVMGFVKVAVLGLPKTMMEPRLASLIPKLLIWSHEHKGHLRAKVKHILERLVRRFGFDVVRVNCPEADRKLLVNIKKSKERSKRKKEAGATEDDKPEHGAERRSGRFENEFDAALYSSDESGESSDSDEPTLATSGKRKGLPGRAYIIEEEHEPLDLLGRGALGKISSTRPGILKQPSKLDARVGEGGKLILGQEKEKDGGTAMEVDMPLEGEETGTGAYVSALKGEDVPRRGLRGKLKWSNRTKAVDDEEDGEDIDQDAVKVIKSAPFRSRRGPRGPSAGRSGRGGIASGRRGLGQDKRHGASQGGRVAKRGVAFRRAR